MKIGATVLGVVGGLLALVLVGVPMFWMGRLFGQVGGAFGASDLGLEYKLLGVGLPLVGLLGGVLVRFQAVLAGALMLASGIGILAMLGVQSGTVLSGGALLVGGLLALVVGIKPKAAQAS
jgi:hypothetical protein